MTPSRRSWLVFALLWALLLGLAAWRPLAVPDEGRYGEIGRWMLQSGDWLTPRLNGIPFFHKPPYVYWLEALSLATFGVSAWALRVVPALHAGLMLVALYLAARLAASEPVARRAALMLGSSLAFLMGGQYVNHDMAVAAWIGVAIWCFALALVRLSPGRSTPAPQRQRAQWLARLGFAACGFGFLSKGLIGVALPGLVLLIWLVWTRRWRGMAQLPWFSGLALLALISAPWLALAQHQYPDLLNYMFGKHQVGRYTGTAFNNARAWWFYLPVIVGLLFPWALFVPLQALASLRRTLHPPRTALPMEADLIRLCWVWWLAILVFFSVPNSKLVGYMLPVMPPLALLAALGYERWFGASARARPVFLGLMALALGIAGAAHVAAVRYTSARSTQDVARVLACEAGAGDRIYVTGHFPYDLPFLIRSPQPMIAVQDWPRLRHSAGDGWQRELFEGAAFEPGVTTLQTPDVLPAAAQAPGNWLLVPRDDAVPGAAAAPWVLRERGAGWVLFRSGGPLAPKGPEAAEHKGLPGCKSHAEK